MNKKTEKTTRKTGARKKDARPLLTDIAEMPRRSGKTSKQTLSNAVIKSRIREEFQIELTAAEIKSVVSRCIQEHQAPEAASDQTRPKISVIVPVYGTEEYLEECLTSLVSQSERDLEIILVDDHSPDRSNDIIAPFIIADPRIRLVRTQKNRGLLLARQVGIRFAKGHYIANVDSDDILSDDILQKCLEKASSENADVVQFRMQKLIEGELKPHEPSHCPYGQLEGPQIFSAFLNREINFSLCNKFYRRSLWVQEQSKFPRSSLMVEDMSQNLHLLRAAKKFCSIDDVGYFYRITPNSDSRSANINSIGFRAFSAARHVAKLKCELGKEGLLDRYLPKLSAFEKSVYKDYAKKLVHLCNTEKDPDRRSELLHWIRKVSRINGYLPLRNFSALDQPVAKAVIGSLDRPESNRPDVSIVVPVFNIGDYLDQCLASLSAQTLKDLQIVVVNDCSTDDSAAIIDRWCAKDSRFVRIDHSRNKGLLQSRLTGVRHATGKYIGHVDGDDWVDASMFSTLFHKAMKTDADIVQCGYNMAYENRNRAVLAKEVKDRNFTDVLRDFLAVRNVSNCMWNKLYKRELWVAAMPYFPKITYKAEDVCQNTFLMAFATSLVHIGEPLYHYRIREGSGDRSQSAHNIGFRAISACYNMQRVRYAVEAMPQPKFLQEAVTKRENGYFSNMIEALNTYGNKNPFYVSQILSECLSMVDLRYIRFISRKIQPPETTLQKPAVPQRGLASRVVRKSVAVFVRPVEDAVIRKMSNDDGYALYRTHRDDYLKTHRFLPIRAWAKLTR